VDHEYWMRRALDLAAKAGALGEVPVGAVVVLADDSGGKIIGEGFNNPINLHDPSAHAEIIALRAAAKQLANYRLPDCYLYVTLEPCTMCVGAMIHARIKHLVFATNEPKAGMIESAFSLPQLPCYNHRFDVTSGVLQEEASTMLSEFFNKRRTEHKQTKRAHREGKEDI